MTVLIYIGLYILGMVAFCFWDSFIGFPADFDGHRNPPTGVVSIVWPIAAPILACMSLSNFLNKIKREREYKEEQQIKIRVAAQKEQEALLKQVEAELEENTFNERKGSH